MADSKWVSSGRPTTEQQEAIAELAFENPGIGENVWRERVPMKTKPGKSDTEISTVLSVSPFEQDHVAVPQILTRSKRTNFKLKLKTSTTLALARAVLEKTRIPVMLVERDLSPGSWRDLLEHSARLPSPPLLIVTSLLADERLWAEVLNLGAWDVLAKPFDAQEVCRVVEGAWQHWRNQHEKRWMHIRNPNT
jgi:hypothetical protein